MRYCIYKPVIMIKMQVIGNLGKDCTTNMVSGKSVINFSVAHTERYKDSQGNMKDKTIWVECAYWTDRTAVAPYLKKGQQVYVEGAPDIRTYTKADGTTGVSLTLRVLSVQLLGSASRNEEEGGLRPLGEKTSMATSDVAASGQPAADDDMPF
jgi:single-strand DNA-binding protein